MRIPFAKSLCMNSKRSYVTKYNHLEQKPWPQQYMITTPQNNVYMPTNSAENIIFFPLTNGKKFSFPPVSQAVILITHNAPTAFINSGSQNDSTHMHAFILLCIIFLVWMFFLLQNLGCKTTLNRSV